jgi:hypothetical protein
MGEVWGWCLCWSSKPVGLHSRGLVGSIPIFSRRNRVTRLIGEPWSTLLQLQKSEVTMRFCLGWLVVTLVAVLAVSSAEAQPMMSAGPMHPIRVNKCDPQFRTNAYPGYVAGYYPRLTPWGWVDVYGYRYMQPPPTTTAHLGIDYVNITNKVMSTIEFGLLARGTLVAEVRDVGTFSPGAEIKHEFGISPNVFPLGTGLSRCVPLRITFSDGTKWRNPHLPAIQRTVLYP